MRDKTLCPDNPKSGSELAYAPQDARGLRARLMRAIENLSGLQEVRPQYEIWRRDVAGKHPRMFNVGLDMLGTRLKMHAPHWPPLVAQSEPLVMICNHPFGIGDGIAALALAEDLGRPYRVLLNKAFMRVPEVQPYALPIDFDETREAVETNLRTRNAVRALMKQGVTMIVFPAGSVATARVPWGRAEELPWKAFAARLIQQSRASVLPVWFEGQNSAFFHAMSHVAGSLRMSLLVAEFRRFVGREIGVHIGPLTPYGALKSHGDHHQLLDELFVMVHRLAPHNAGMMEEALKPRPSRGWSWDRPLARRRRH